MLQHRPWFTLSWSCLVGLLWAVAAFCSDVDTESSKVGLESVFPDKTDLRIHTECQDHSLEIWRWWLYQFSHVGLSHVATNCALLVILGIPLEGFHGTPKAVAAFQVGVVAAAMSSLFVDPHTAVVGMSGGCYSFLGVHLADLLINWRQRRYRWATLLVLLFLNLWDLVVGVAFSSDDSVAYGAHFGGYLAGICICRNFGRHLVNYGASRIWKIAALGLTLLCAVFLGVWSQLWPPRGLTDLVPWCWHRQVFSFDRFGDYNWHCVRCYSQICIQQWSAFQTYPIAVSTCSQLGGWSSTELV